LTGNYNHGFTDDSNGNRRFQDRSLTTTLSHTFTLNWPGGIKLPTESYVRHRLNESFGRDLIFNDQDVLEQEITLNRSWYVGYGFSVALF